jgi:hypothetical protein
MINIKGDFIFFKFLNFFLERKNIIYLNLKISKGYLWLPVLHPMLKTWIFFINLQNLPSKEVIFFNNGKRTFTMGGVQLGHHEHLLTIPQLLDHQGFRVSEE